MLPVTRIVAATTTSSGPVTVLRLIVLLHLMDITGKSYCTAMHQRFYGEFDHSTQSVGYSINHC